MINGLKQLKNLSIPQKLIRQLIIKIFQAKIKLGQGARAAKTEAIKNLYNSKQTKTNQESNKKFAKRLQQSCINNSKDQNNYEKYILNQKIISGMLI